MSDPQQQPFLTMRDAVLEIRGDVKDLRTQLERIDRTGSIGTKQELLDHEERLRSLESAGFRVAGAWTAVLIGCSTAAGVAGLALGVFTAIH